MVNVLRRRLGFNGFVQRVVRLRCSGVLGADKQRGEAREAEQVISQHEDEACGDDDPQRERDIAQGVRRRWQRLEVLEAASPVVHNCELIRLKDEAERCRNAEKGGDKADEDDARAEQRAEAAVPLLRGAPGGALPCDSANLRRVESSKMLGGASQIVSRIRTKCNGIK